MGPDLLYPGDGTSDGLIDALENYWSDRGELDLAAITPKLKEFAKAHAAEVERSDGKVDIFVYTMF
jgi:hypothetical protein